MIISQLEAMIKKLIECEKEIATLSERIIHINHEMAIFCKIRIDNLIEQRTVFYKELFGGTEIKPQDAL
jgi:hypothetical protein